MHKTALNLRNRDEIVNQSNDLIKKTDTIEGLCIFSVKSVAALKMLSSLYSTNALTCPLSGAQYPTSEMMIAERILIKAHDRLQSDTYTYATS